MGALGDDVAEGPRTLLLGATHDYRFTERLSSRTTLYGSGSAIKTPFLIDFERNTQLGAGGRTTLSYRTALAGRTLRLQGGELVRDD